MSATKSSISLSKLFLIFLVGCFIVIGLMIFRNRLPYLPQIADYLGLSSIPLDWQIWDTLKSNPLGSVTLIGTTVGAVTTLTKTLTSQGSQLTTLAKQVEAGSVDFNNLQLDFLGKSEELDKAKETLAVVQTQINTVSDQKTLLESQILTWKGQAESAVNEAKQMEGAVTYLKTELATVQDTAKATVTSLESQLSEAKASVDSVVSQAKDEVEMLQAEVISIKDAVTEEVAKVKSEADTQLQETNRMFEDTTKQYENYVSSANAKIEEVQTQAEQYKMELDAVASSAKSYESAYNAASAELASLKAEKESALAASAKAVADAQKERDAALYALSVAQKSLNVKAASNTPTVVRG